MKAIIRGTPNMKSIKTTEQNEQFVSTLIVRVPTGKTLNDGSGRGKKTWTATVESGVGEGYSLSSNQLDSIYSGMQVVFIDPHNEKVAAGILKGIKQIDDTCDHNLYCHSMKTLTDDYYMYLRTIKFPKGWESHRGTKVVLGNEVNSKMVEIKAQRDELPWT